MVEDKLPQSEISSPSSSIMVKNSTPVDLLAMRKRLFDLFLVNVLTCGLEICMATGTIYIPPMLLEAGVQERFMTMVLGVGPVLGLMLVPALGSASDRCCSRYGRRRPFIWALCVGVLLGILVVPRASQIASLISEQHQNGLKVLLLVLSICVLQFCGQACFTPLEALVSDLYPGEVESRQAFSVYSIMLSLGGCIGYLLPAIDWTGLGPSLYLGSQEAFIYFLLTGIFLMCLMSTALISEKPMLGAVTETTRRSQSLYEVCCWPLKLFSRAQMLKCAMLSLVEVIPRLRSVCSHVPRVILKLFVAELCSWMALMTFVLFYTDFVGEGLYDGVPSADPGSPERLRYEKGVRVASLGLFLQCVTSVTFSIMMERMVECVGARVLYLSSLVLLALSTAVMTISSSVVLVTVMAAMTGYTFCTLQILPYTLACLYHSDKQVFFSSSRSKLMPSRGDLVDSAHKPISALYQNTNGCLNGSHMTKQSASPSLNSHVSLDVDALPGFFQPQRGMCLDIAILDSAYLLSQVVPSLFMGSIVQLFGSVTAYMVCASVLSLLAVFFSSRIIFTRQEMEMLK